ncbi:hypothetical protein AVEN_224130-1 [Araneus ventricosus]|uniref:Uncharacterized protein n=1 Tax=Araneus ventricosus TaxID=182803 RepID=A0A4Y2IEN6_ARAVE|nr:hypothetical protein AVEN_224130-1 [Araneus ventricosus]
MDGSRHLWHFISSSRYLPKKYRDIIEPVISRTAYFAVPENMLLAMLTERDAILEPLEIGELSRQGKLAQMVIVFVDSLFLLLTFELQTMLRALIDWQACNVIPPTVIIHISSHVLLKMMQDDMPMDGRDFIKFPSHTQADERIVKLVTEASRKRVGPHNRDGIIRATLKSRKQMSQFESKKHYKK